jgi:serine/threonine protein kinase
MAKAIGVGTPVGDYRIVGLLGKGGMGAVYRAEHTPTGETVALKVLSSSLAHNEEFRQRFLREAEYLAELDHPNIVRVREVAEADGYVFMAQRIVEGTDLEALLAVEGALDAPRALAILDQVAHALDAVHDKGLLHRDIKPANVLIGGEARTEQAFLTDFGLSKHPTRESRALTVAGDFVGNFYYAAPEQALGKSVGPEADVYALGCILYECLTGERPFERERAVELLEAHIEDPPPQITAKLPDLPAAIDGVVARALAKDPSSRYRRATELVASARDALGVARVRPEAQRLRLLVTAGQASGELIDVDGELEIGRLTTGPGALAGDPELSRRHARIRQDDGAYVIEDVGSTNGTAVNGRLLTEPHVLSPGDTIEAGSTTLRVEAVASPVARAPALATTPAPRPALAPESSPAPVESDSQPPPRVELRVEIDLAAGEATITLAEGSDSVRLVHDGGSWRLVHG